VAPRPTYCLDDLRQLRDADHELSGHDPAEETYIAEFNRRGCEIEHLRSQLTADDLLASIAKIKSFGCGALWCADQLEKTAYRIRAAELPFPSPLFDAVKTVSDPAE
jgi:hypothetical protein